MCSGAGTGPTSSGTCGQTHRVGICATLTVSIKTDYLFIFSSLKIILLNKPHLLSIMQLISNAIYQQMCLIKENNSPLGPCTCAGC